MGALSSCCLNHSRALSLAVEVGLALGEAPPPADDIEVEPEAVVRDIEVGASPVAST